MKKDEPRYFVQSWRADLRKWVSVCEDMKHEHAIQEAEAMQRKGAAVRLVAVSGTWTYPGT